MKLLKNLGVICLVLIFVFSPLSFSNVFVHSQEGGFEEITDYQEWTQDKVISGIINVNYGATLVIKNGVTLTFNNGSINVDGKMIVSGTVKKPVFFRKAESAGNYAITVGGEMIMRNVDMSGAGYDVYMAKNNSVLNSAKAFFVGGISVNSGTLDAEGCNFHDNDVAVNVSYGSAKVNRSKFANNSIIDAAYNGNGSANFQYNWWGSARGPAEICDALNNCYYEKVDGDINVSNWLTQENFKDPVIIIPGILGSWEKEGQLQIDPIFHTYDNLYEEFANNGYTPEKNLFVFPYEWRDSNVKNAKLLRDKINEIKISQNWPKVDLVAHSMGGLLAREYIESDYYGNDVDQLISLATPNLGAPEAYIKWDGGDWFFSPVDMYMKHIIKQEAKEGGFSDVFDYIHNRPITSLQELLPVYSYLYDANNGNNLRIYPDNYPRNEFLENLNNNSGKLNFVEYDKIIGNIGEDNTISGIDVINTDMGKYWIHGYPLGFEIIIGDRGMRYSNGDITVPLDSARSVDIKSDNLIELTSDHQSIVTDAQKDVLELLTNVRPATEVRHSLIRDILIAQAFSPIDIQIVAPDGKKAGKNFETGEIYNEIEGAYYTGYNTDTEFLTIPDPQDGDYKIIIQGTGSGDYKVEMTKISEDEISGQASESTGVINGMAAAGQQAERILEVRGNEVLGGDTAEEPDPTIDSIIGDVGKYYDQGLIKSGIEKKYLLNKLEEIKKILEAGGKWDGKYINNKIDNLIKEIQKKNNWQVDQSAKDSLTEDLESLKSS